MNQTATLDLGNAETDLIDRVKTAFARRTEGRAVILLILVLIWASIWESTVFSAYEVTLGRLALIGLTAVGLTAVILMGELDLSIASILAVSGVVMASFDNVAVGITVSLAIGLVIGAVNAFFVVVVGINSFIATLGMLFFLRGLAFVISDGEPVTMANKDFALDFGKPLIGEFTPRVLIFVLAFIAMHLFLTRVRVGREFYAVGGNREAARDAGIPVRRRVFTGFMISGFVAASAGIIVTLQLTAADPTAGGDALLTSFAAAIVGGILLNGGRGSVLGTLLGAAALAILQVGMTFNGIESDVQNIIIGLVLFVAVITDPNSIRAVVGSARAFLSSRSASDPAADEPSRVRT
jgi:ribose/xylose/arabinose/galactoside ABC-type transport system permease subunit